MKYNIMYESIFDKKNKKILKNCSFFNLKKVKHPKKIHVIYSFLQKKYDEKYLSRFVNLKFFLTASTGIDHIDIDYLKKNNIKLIKLNTKSKKVKEITSTGELIITILLAAIRKLNKYLELSKKGIFRRDKYKIYQFKNYKIGLIGYGRISQYLFKILNVLKFNIAIFDKNKKKYSKNLLNLLRSSDAIIVNIPLENNYNFIDYKKLINCKKNVIIINTSRALIFNQTDLFLILKRFKYIEYWTDVYESNFSKNNLFNRLIKLKNFFQTPHIGGATQDAMRIAEKIVFEKLKIKLNVIK